MKQSADTYPWDHIRQCHWHWNCLVTFNNLFSAQLFLLIKIINESNRRQSHKRGQAQKHSFTKSPHALRNVTISFIYLDRQILSDNNKAVGVLNSLCWQRSCMLAEVSPQPSCPSPGRSCPSQQCSPGWLQPGMEILLDMPSCWKQPSPAWAQPKTGNIPPGNWLF